MGLDIYLYRYENRKQTEKKESEYNKYSDKAWKDAGGYGSLTEKQRESVRSKEKEFANSLGLDEYGDDKTGKQKIEFDSAKYPDHYFKVGYFRSSYNGGGINHVLKNLGMGDLYDFFEREHDDASTFKPDWQKVRDNVTDAITKLKSLPNLRCFNVGWNEFKGSPQNAKITNEQQALELFIERSKTFRDDSDGFSCADGDFYPKGIKVFGLISGVNKRFFVEEKLPSTYVVVEGENEWYINALEIIIETADYVLSQPDNDKYYLYWSS